MAIYAYICIHECMYVYKEKFYVKFRHQKLAVLNVLTLLLNVILGYQT